METTIAQIMTLGIDGWLPIASREGYPILWGDCAEKQRECLESSRWKGMGAETQRTRGTRSKKIIVEVGWIRLFTFQMINAFF